MPGFLHAIENLASRPKPPCRQFLKRRLARLFSGRVQEDAGLGVGPAGDRIGERRGIALGIPYTEKTFRFGGFSALRSHSKDRDVALGNAPRQRAHAVGAGDEDGLDTAKIERRTIPEPDRQKRRQQRLMTHGLEAAGDFLAILKRPCDQNSQPLLPCFGLPWPPPADLESGDKGLPLDHWTILGLETSCDETAAAVVRGAPPGPGKILSNIVFSQNEAHAPYGGVVPEIASRAHLEILDGLVEQALSEAGTTLDQVDAIAATAGPGLIGGVMVGLTTAKALALATGKPLLAINHLAGHALTARLTHGVDFPFLLLLISGGHCQLLAVEGPTKFRLYGSTMDDAVGEAFDKTAKQMGLPYPGGPNVERHAARGNPNAYALPRPLLGRDGMDFSFSGLKTAVRQLTAQKQAQTDDVCASFPSEAKPVLVVAGGVAANRAIGGALEQLAGNHDFEIRVPPPNYCTDNAAMIAWAGLERCALGARDPLDFSPRARWPLASLDGDGQGGQDGDGA